jgi:acyl-CoA dehydrogenase
MWELARATRFWEKPKRGEIVKDAGGISQKARTSIIASEELAWGDPALVITFPGAGLGAAPIKILRTGEWKERFFNVFKNR